MKLLNQSLIYMALTFFVIIGVWSVIFYINLKDEIRDSIDDGLDNNKLLIIQKVKTDSTLLLQREFGGNNFEIHPVSKEKALAITDVFQDTLMYRQNEDDLEPVRILHSAFQYNNQYYRLKVISSLVEEDDLIEDSFWGVVSLFLILVSSIIILNNVILKRVWNPFYDILNRLKAYRLDKNGATLEVRTNTKEFTELQNASNALIAHAKEAYLSQKQFTENASHELQTPLAIIRNKLELLLESENLNQTDAQSIVEVIQMAERLTLLNKSLLLLAKIDNKQFPNETDVALETVSNTILENFQDFSDFKAIQITKQINSNVTIFMDPALADTLISNLIKNAIFHNKTGGRVHLELSPTHFRICNSGSQLSLNAQSIFNRFEKDASKTKSSGLGLAICKAICKLYNFDIRYTFENNLHCFLVTFQK
ncbi:MAG: histidine kinase dimerization/phospho-acceptor domain-containing protein [Xanthomarina gelatinilytica]|uniref:PorY family sensor histidine kinase n=1 Tax=Xanthomarina gelatinilytica TaxID=1137281 RepID=UPI003A89727B